MTRRAHVFVAITLALVSQGCRGSDTGGTERGGQDTSMGIDGWTVYEQLADKPWAELTEGQQLLVALGDLRSELNNGGFDQYFFNSAGDHATTAVDAARIAGQESLADLVSRAMEALPGGYSPDRDRRQGALEDLDPDALAVLDDEYFEIESTVDLDGAMNDLAGRA
jgi:hypothetical protein